jgi:hypothetical protein
VPPRVSQVKRPEDRPQRTADLIEAIDAMIADLRS